MRVNGEIAKVLKMFLEAFFCGAFQENVQRLCRQSNGFGVMFNNILDVMNLLHLNKLLALVCQVLISRTEEAVAQSF